jgi:chromosome segregation ATPase
MYSGTGYWRRREVPVTAKLSRKFYEALGDEVANELVTWLNAVDESYRAEFRELFAANFGRLEAEIRALNQRLSTLEVRFEALAAQTRAFEARMESRFAALESRVTTLETSIGARFDRFEARMLRWMLVFWAGTMGTVIGLLKL